MFDRLKQLLAPPVYEDEIANRRARLLNIILLSMIAMITMLWLVRLGTNLFELTSQDSLVIGGMPLFLMGVYIATRFRYLQFGMYALVFGIWTGVTFLIWSNDGVKDSAILAYFVIVLVASLLSGWRLGAILIALSVAAGWGFVYAESVGLHALTKSAPASELMTDYTFLFGLSGVMIYLLVSSLQNALRDARQSNQELQAFGKELEKQVGVRTQALETSINISHHLTTILDPVELVAEVVKQVRSAFNYYHAQIYLFDESDQDLLLVGGTGEAGQALLAKSHKISRGQGLVGQAARDNRVILVPDTKAATNWLPNPLLPETKAEIAVPISLGEQVLGVLDVQHDVINGLTENDSHLLESVAAQVAVALRNARLYSQAQQQATQETIINEIGQRIQSAANVEMVMQIAARELAQNLGAPRAAINISRDAIVGYGRNPREAKL